MGDQRVIRMDLAYDGTEFAGFNLQPGRRTVQAVLEETWSSITGEAVRMTAAGRTDAGVHAAGQVVSTVSSSALPPPALLRAVNALAPEDLVVHRLVDAPSGFDARRSAVRRHYRYTIWNHPLRNIRWRRFSLHVPKALDVARMQDASEALLGTYDFRGFGSRLSQSPPVTTRRTIESADWTVDDEGFIHFDIAADGFLRHMVRGIVGAMLRVGHGRLGRDDIQDVLAQGYGRGAGLTALPHGLTLTRVDYQDSMGN